MDRKWVYGFLGGCILLLAAVSCRKETKDPVGPSQPYEPTPDSVSYPAYFPDLPMAADNPMTKEGVKLGRMLYYDRKLSENGPNDGFSCASCHIQATAFSSPAAGRAVLPHINLGWNHAFLWDGNVEGSLEDIMRFEVIDFFNADMSVLAADPEYPKLFEQAFGSKEITGERTAFAIAQFARTMVSGNSRYDKALKGEIFLTDEELNGYDLFFTEKGDCFHCHSDPLFSDNLYHNIGLDSIFTGEDLGRYNFTAELSDIGKVKTPTLRNVALTAPYMHDGRFATLEEVIDHYDHGVKPSNTLDPIMTKPGKEFGLQLTDEEKSDLVAFLKALTDTSFISNPDFGNPF